MTSTLLTSVGYGRNVGLQFATEDLPEVRTLLPFWWRDEDVEPEHIWQVSGSLAYEMVVGSIELWVAEHAIDLIFVHAGVVALNGRALLLPGRSFTGKSTLVAELLRAGAEYGSDEYAVIDDDGLVHPYPRPISMRELDGSRRRVTPEELGTHSFAEPMPVGMVASIRRVEDGVLDIHEVSAAAAVLDLIDNTVSAQSRPEAALTACAAAVDGSRAFAGTRQEAKRSAQRILELLDGASQP